MYFYSYTLCLQVPTDDTTTQPFPTASTTTTTVPPVIITTASPPPKLVEVPRSREQPRRLDIFNVRDEEELQEEPSFGDNLDQEDADISPRSQDSQSITQSLFDQSRSDPIRPARPFVGRPLRPVPTRAPSRPHNQAPFSRARAPVPDTRAPVSQPRTPVSQSRALAFQPRNPVSQARTPVSQARAPASQARAPVSQPRAPVSQQRAPVSQQRAPVSQPRAPVSQTGASFVTEEKTQAPKDQGAFEYEYYYDYLDTEDTRGNTEYDLVPLANKVISASLFCTKCLHPQVRILSDGMPHCLDVGVFPHPFSCKKFINCFRNPGADAVIQGSIYQCPSYLAFDPVGGRCNWVNEIVCTSAN